MRYLPGLAIALAAALTGCETTTPTEVPVQPPPPTYIPIRNEANVVIPGQVKAYGVDRYVDPADPTIMHERHVIYRQEGDAQWNLKTSAERQILIGNTMTDGKLDDKRILKQELPAELERQRAAATALHSAAGNLTKTAGNLEVERIKMMKQNAELNAKVKDLEERLSHIETAKSAAATSTNAPPVDAGAKKPTPNKTPTVGNDGKIEQ